MLRAALAKGVTVFCWVLASLLTLPGDSHAANAPPRMLIPGQFAVSSTGAATYSIPIVVPPGTAGMIPSLELNYSSQGRDGLVGLGWAIGGLQMITRCPRTMAQDGVHGGVNFDSNDRFCLDGQRLVLVNGTTYGADGSQYSTEVESFSKITAHGTAGSGPSWFEVQTKGGQILYFGQTPDSQAPLVAVPGSQTGQPGTVRSWAVNKISDTRGNYLSVTYDNGHQDTTNGQIYPTQISYTGNSTTGLAAYNSIQFVYSARAPQDINPAYQAGSLLQTTVLLTDVITCTAVTNPCPGSHLVYDYHLSYNLNSSGATFDELTSITLCGGDGKCLLPTTFSWPGHGDQLNLTSKNTNIVQGGYVYLYLQKDPVWINRQLTAADFDGDGVTDLLGGSGGTWAPIDNCTPSVNPNSARTFKGNGDGNFTAVTLNQNFTLWSGQTGTPATDTPCQIFEGAANFNVEGLTDFVIGTNQYLNQGPWGALLNDGKVSNNSPGSLNEFNYVTSSNIGSVLLGDFDGNGLTDLITWGNGQNGNADSYLYTAGANGLFSATDLSQNGFISYLFDGGAAPVETAVGDFDGDGCNDLLEAQFSTIVITYFCKSRFTQVTINVAQWLPNWSTYGICSGFVQVADLNGDGKSDLILTIGCGYPGTIFLSTGTGFTKAPYAPPTFDGSLVIGDWNGDGRDSIAAIQVDSTKQLPHTVYLSTSTGFIQAASIANTNPLDSNPPNETTVQDESGTAGDWNSDGATDLWLQKPSGDVEYLFAPFAPQLISAINNGAATTNIAYQSLNTNGSFYTKGTGATYPTKDVDGPTYVVSRVDSDVSIRRGPRVNRW